MKKFLIIVPILLVFMCCCASADNQGKVKYSNEVKITQTIFVDSVWVANQVNYGLQTVGNMQFVAYYDRNRVMTVASRELGRNQWIKHALPNQLRWDSHNYVALGVDKAGYIHVSGNMHVNPLAYYRSSKPYDVTSMIELNNMVGELEDSVTYPKFFYDKNNELYFSYRAGTCGDGNVVVNHFDTESLKWERYISDPLFVGRVGGENRAAYHNQVKDTDGNFHYAWVWRWTPMVETTHQLCYATSPDLKSWKNAAGEVVELPLIPDNEMLIVDGVESKGGLHNGRYTIKITPHNKPILAYLKYDEQGMTQLYMANLKSGKWQSKKISDWKFRWEFIGGGDQMTSGALFSLDGFSDDGLVVIGWRNELGESGEYVVDYNSLEHSNRVAVITQQYPRNVKSRMSNNAELQHVNVQDDSGTPPDSAKYLLKWESKSRSHGRNAPKVIPDGPVSGLVVLKIE